MKPPVLGVNKAQFSNSHKVQKHFHYQSWSAYFLESKHRAANGLPTPRIKARPILRFKREVDAVLQQGPANYSVLLRSSAGVMIVTNNTYLPI